MSQCEAGDPQTYMYVIHMYKCTNPSLGTVIPGGGTEYGWLGCGGKGPLGSGAAGWADTAGGANHICPAAGAGVWGGAGPGIGGGIAARPAT